MSVTFTIDNKRVTVSPRQVTIEDANFDPARVSVLNLSRAEHLSIATALKEEAPAKR